jgi:hypothetical protein
MAGWAATIGGWIEKRSFWSKSEPKLKKQDKVFLTIRVIPF